MPLLNRLLALPDVRDAARPPGLYLDHHKERRAYLVLALARSLARCGRKEGLVELAELVADPRALYARSAHMELKALTGMDHPLDRQVWIEGLSEWPQSFAPAPWEVEVV